MRPKANKQPDSLTYGMEWNEQGLTSIQIRELKLKRH